jgi:hypothetical protein
METYIDMLITPITMKSPGPVMIWMIPRTILRMIPILKQYCVRSRLQTILQKNKSETYIDMSMMPITMQRPESIMIPIIPTPTAITINMIPVWVSVVMVTKMRWIHSSQNERYYRKKV